MEKRVHISHFNTVQTNHRQGWFPTSKYQWNLIILFLFCILFLFQIFVPVPGFCSRYKFLRRYFSNFSKLFLLFSTVYFCTEYDYLRTSLNFKSYIYRNQYLFHVHCLFFAVAVSNYVPCLSFSVSISVLVPSTI